MEIFSDGSRYLKICYTNIIPVRKIFSFQILFGRWLMVIPTIDHDNSVPDTRVVGSLSYVYTRHGTGGHAPNSCQLARDGHAIAFTRLV